ncbi:MAG: glycine zipper domain-containing protein [Mariniblastus sp.]
MLIRFSVMFLTLALVASPAVAQSYNRTVGPTTPQKAAVAGGIAGAILGGIAGHQNDETPEGIAIGGAVGAIAGGLLGKAKENQMVRDYHQQQYQQQQQVVRHQQRQQQIKEAVSVNDAISLAQTGVGDTLIINQIRSNGVRQKIGVREIISMHQNGVSELVINEMQKTSLAGIAQPVQTAVATRPVYIQPQPRVIVERREVYQMPSRSSHYHRYHR